MCLLRNIDIPEHACRRLGPSAHGSAREGTLPGCSIALEGLQTCVDETLGGVMHCRNVSNVEMKSPVPRKNGI